MARRKTPGKRKGSMLDDSIFYDSRLADLSFSAFRLFIELNQQYNGFNNGNLSTALGCLRFNWDRNTVKKARNELLRAGVIELIRLGYKRKPHLYALTHMPVNECEKNNIRAESCCRNRATGQRSNYFPKRRDIQKLKMGVRI